ncbi:MAG: FHA domain-containing protein [Clostridia bacterium]|nr:FHA domain-containing protein [Clostridia bacterium]
MPYIVRVYHLNSIYSIDLTNYSVVTIGKSQKDTLCLDVKGLKKEHIRIYMSDGEWVISAKGLLYRENSRIKSEKMFQEFSYVLKTDPEIYIAVHPKQEDCLRQINLDQFNIITFGRQSDNDVVLKNIRTSSHHCKIYRYDGNLYVEDCESRNGTYLNGKRVQRRRLFSNDIINLSVYHIILLNDILYFYNTGDDIEFNVPTEAVGSIDYGYEENESRTVSLM